MIFDYSSDSRVRLGGRPLFSGGEGRRKVNARERNGSRKMKGSTGGEEGSRSRRIGASKKDGRLPPQLRNTGG